MTTKTRRKSRELAMQMLFQADMGHQSEDEVRATFWRAGDPVEVEVRGFAEDLFRIAMARQAEIDELILKNSKNWRIERMAVVDRNLLRAAVAELLEYPNTPGPIIINESLEVARRYAAPESINFLNGLLDAVAHAILPK